MFLKVRLFCYLICENGASMLEGSSLNWHLKKYFKKYMFLGDSSTSLFCIVHEPYDYVLAKIDICFKAKFTINPYFQQFFAFAVLYNVASNLYFLFATFVNG